MDLGRSEIRVERSWDQVEGPVEPKSATSTRTLPLLALLRDYLDEHKLATGRRGEELAFGRTATDAFVPSTVRTRARAAWEAAGLEPITLHECRHTFASLMIAAGENAKAIQTFMGHATITDDLRPLRAPDARQPRPGPGCGWTITWQVFPWVFPWAPRRPRIRRYKPNPHHPDAVLDGRARARRRERLSTPPDFTTIGPDQPGEDLQQRRLAGAVLADERVRLALRHIEADAAQGVHGAKGFLNVVELQAQTAKW